MKKVLSVFKWISLSFLGVITILSFAIGIYVKNILEKTPDVDAQHLNTYETSKIVDSKGNVIWQPTDKYVEVFTYEEIPSLIKDGIVAVEDEDYWTNKGFSIKGVANMVYSVLRSKVDSNYTARGGSTIDQQLIKNTYYNGGYGHSTVVRKIQELFLAKQLDENFDKKQILVYYLNHLSYAEGVTGMKGMMKTYFGKTPDMYAERTPQNIAEQAYLIGLGQAPTTYNLYENAEKAHERTHTVLKVLKDSKLITKQEYKDSKNYDLTSGLKPRFWKSEEQRVKNLKYKVYTDAVLNELSEKGYNINEATLTVETFLDPETFDAITNKARDPQYYQDEHDEQIAVTVMNKDGIVVGMVGSRHEGDEYNRALQQNRSSGSSMKPFTAYGPLFQYLGHQYNTASKFDSSPYQYPGSTAVMYNYGKTQYGYVDNNWALRTSLNTTVARIDDEVLGPHRMKTFLNGLGLDNKETYSSVDGIGLNISTLQAAAAYNSLNNDGVYIKPRFINKIRFIDGSEKVLEAEKRQAMNPSTAWVLTQMLRGVPTQGYSASQAYLSKSGYGGKTGTVAFDENVNPPAPYGYGGSDSWYDSITNNGYSVAIWFGYDEPNTSPQVADAFDGPQWLGRDLQAMLGGGDENWTRPSGVVDVGGSGIHAHYGISDSKDITQDLNISISDVSVSANSLKYNDITYDIVGDWESGVVNKKLYELYKKDYELINNMGVIDKDVYEVLP